MCEKKIIITLQNQKVIESGWFEDEDKNREAKATNRTVGESKVYNALIEQNGLGINDVDHWVLQRKREDGIIYISEHAMQRLWERNGWNRKTALRMIKKIYDNGIHMENVKKNVKKWLEAQLDMSAKGYYYIVYGQFAYLFNYNTLVTLIHIPNQLVTNA